MNTQIVTKIETIEKELYDLKTLLQTETIKKSYKKSNLSGLWKGLKIKDKELENAQKEIFDFDVEKYVK